MFKTFWKCFSFCTGGYIGIACIIAASQTLYEHRERVRKNSLKAE